MTVSTLDEIMGAIAGQLSEGIVSDIDDLQVEPGLMWNPTPPAIDIYPADPLFEDVSFGPVSKFRLVVRARVDTPDREGAQETLLLLMDPDSDVSVRNVLYEDTTLSGKADNILVSSPSDFGFFTEPGGSPLLGCTWIVEVYV